MSQRKIWVGSHPSKRFQTDKDITQYTEQDHLILEATPYLSQMDELRLEEQRDN